MLRGITYYQYTAIDKYSRLAFAKVYKNKTSRNTKLFIQEAMKYFGFSISKVQTESDSIAFHFVGLRKNRHIRCKKCYAHYNGSEFMGEFDKYLKEIGIEQSDGIAFHIVGWLKNRRIRCKKC
jgi:hypothetical protein